MGKLLDSLTPKLEEFIVKQHIFFVGTAMKEGRVNVSPKGMDTFKVINENKVIWLNLTGSGNETAQGRAGKIPPRRPSLADPARALHLSRAQAALPGVHHL